MKLSTKGRYGLKAMLDLGLNFNKGYVSLKDIAYHQDISERYLEQLMAVLKKGGFVISSRGAMGGYSLAVHPSKITVGNILRCLEGSLAPVDCVIEDTHTNCDKYETCITKVVWKKIRDSINNVVDSITLEDLINENEKINK